MKEHSITIKHQIGLQIAYKIFGILIILLGLFLFWDSIIRLKDDETPLSYAFWVVISIIMILLVVGILCFSEGFRTITVDNEGIRSKSLINNFDIKKEEIESYGELTYPNLHNKRRPSFFYKFVVFYKDNKFVNLKVIGYSEFYNLLFDKIKLDYKKAEIEKINSAINLEIEKQKNNYKNVGKGVAVIIMICSLYSLIFTCSFGTNSIQSDPLPSFFSLLIGISIYLYYEFFSRGY
jgi:hypothetical protein